MSVPGFDAAEGAPRLDADWMRRPAVRAAIAALQAGGAHALFVGGCVRNALLDAPVGDVDIATEAPPARVQALFDAAGLRHLPTGIEHGTVTAVHQGDAVEVTTFRRDVETDGRRATVAFDADLLGDAARRDFSLNALYADADGTVIDPLGGGIADLRARRVRFIGDPAARIREDRLRILRFFRFHALYGDAGRGLDPESLAACAAAAEGLDDLARERIGAETRKLLGAPAPSATVAEMARAGVLDRLLPGASAGRLAGLEATEAAVGEPPEWTRRLAALGLAPNDAAERLRLSRAERRRLHAIAAALDEAETPAQAAYRHGAPAARDAALLRAAGAGAQPPVALSREVARGAAQRFPVTAGDLIERGATRGPALGRALKRLEDAWIASDFRLGRDELLNLPAATPDP